MCLQTRSASLRGLLLLRRSVVAVCMLLGVAVGAHAQYTEIDLKLEKSISNASPALGDVVTYTVAVTNTGSGIATSVVVSESMTAGLSTFLSSTASVGTFTFNTTSYTGSWTIGSINPGQTVTLLIKATVTGEGVSFNAAEVASMAGTDVNSIPGNGSLVENDYANACFSVPLTWYPGDEYTVSRPAGFTAVTWLVNGNPISGTTTQAGVDASGNLVIRAPGIFSFTGKLNGCDVNNCCNILVNPGGTASLGDYVFEDKNGDGIQNTGDVPLPGVTVTLFQNGTAVSTTTSNGSGLYSFTGLTPGTSTSYSVGFTAPAGFTATIPLSGTDKTKDSDANLVTGRSQSVTLATGESNTTIDAGFYRSASLTGYVFNDANRDGIQNAGDTPIAGVVVTLFQNGSAVATTATAASGVYSFTGLTPGIAYVVGFGKPADFESTSANIGSDALDSDADPITGRSQSVTLVSGSNTAVDAGFYRLVLTAGFGDYVFEDRNANGIQDAGDTPLAGVVVTLYLNGSAVSTTTSSASGSYSFTGLATGSQNIYQVGFSTPSGFAPALANAGTNDALDSDLLMATSRTGTYTLAAGEFNNSVDAGFYRAASLGDYVFNDVNRNGIQDAGDTPLVGVVVTLYQNGSPVSTTTTNASGLYSFTGLTPGSGTTYSIGFTTPPNFTATTPLSGTNRSVDSDADPITGRSQSVSLTSGENNTTVDAGFVPLTVPLGSIGNYVWRDTNNDGIQNDGNTGVAGVTVELFGAVSITTPLAQTVTDGTGAYLFSNLIAGSYRVKFTLPAGETFTLREVGSDRTIDSDPGPDGFSSVIIINTSLPLGNAGRNNLTVDAGVRARCATPLTLLAGTTNMSICVGGSTSVSAVAAGSSVVRWYLDAAAQVLAFTTVSGQQMVVTPAGNLTYYVQAETADGCKSDI
ncbi:MAG TPA: SdrD B-like domain-containing protein, partial [Fibrella sp.]